MPSEDEALERATHNGAEVILELLRSHGIDCGLGVHGAMALRTALQERTPMTGLSP